MTGLSADTHAAILSAFVWSLLHFLWQGSILTLALAVSLKISRRDSAARRHALCYTTLASMILCPILTFAYLKFETSRIASASAIDLLPAAGPHISFLGTEVRAQNQILTWLILAANRSVPAIAVLWLLGVTFLLVRILLGLIEARHLKRRSTIRVPDSLHLIADRLASQLEVICPLMFASSAVTTPIVVGWLRPVILFPSTMFSDAAQVDSEPVLAHELAHIRRRDYLLNAIQAIVEAFLFFHPGVWWTSQQILREREYCCDDLAVQMSGSPLVYAKALTSLEEQRSPAKPQFSLGASGGHLAMRITRLLKQEPAATPKNRIKAALATLSSLTITILCVLSVLATDRVKAQIADSSSEGHALSTSTAEGNRRPDMSCSFYDKEIHSHAGFCEVPQEAKGPFYCKQSEAPMPRQLQSACEWKVQRLRNWEHAQTLPKQ